MAVRVLIVDDSHFFRRRLTEIISSDPNLEVIATASNGREAIALTQQFKPDIITMDIEMPNMDGITATRHIMARYPTAIMMLSTWSTKGAKATFDALDAGAIDYMPKRFEEMSNDHSVAQQRLCLQLRYLANNFRHHRASAHSSVNKPTTIGTINATLGRKSDLKIIAIGTSTGGPVALQQILTELPADFPYPILLIQHMPSTFTPSFAERLNNQCQINVKQACDGDILLPGHAYLAPGGQQTLVTGTQTQLKIAIHASQSDQTYRPSINMTLDSISKVCPKQTLAIILTGMGSDGRDGCRALKQHGALVWSQDQQTSTIYGMPMAIAKAGLADKILSLSDITKQLVEMTQ